MNSRRIYIISCIGLLLIQLVSDNVLDISIYIKLFFIHIIVLNTAISVNTSVLMLSAFLIGMAADLLSGNIIGLYTASLVPVAFLRNRILSITSSKRIGNSNEDFYLEELPNSSIIPYYIAGTVLFITLYFGIESIIAQDSISFFLIRWSVSLILNTVLTLLLTLFVFKR